MLKVGKTFYLLLNPDRTDGQNVTIITTFLPKRVQENFILLKSGFIHLKINVRTVGTHPKHTS